MNRSTTGWIFVAVQAVLLIALVLLPSGQAWSTSAVVTTVGLGVLGMGLIIVAVASVRLGASLRPSPVPAADGELQTDGLYRYVRHPIYSGVLLVVLGLTIRSGSLTTTAVALVTVAFFFVKATWEENRLTEQYSGYEAYAARTPRFIPLGALRENPDS